MGSRDNHARGRLVRVLANLPPDMHSMLELRTAQARLIAARTDVLWYLLLQSMSTLQSSAGHKRIFPDGREPLATVRWEALAGLSKAGRKAALGSSFASVRMGERKADFLLENHRKIESMGGLAAATVLMQRLAGLDAKMNWVQQFDGIGKKYARNIWMDIRDKDFEQSIAVDSRLESVGRHIGMGQGKYESKEAFFLAIAHDAGLSGWEADRLIYNFHDRLLEMADISPLPGRDWIDGKEHCSAS